MNVANLQPQKQVKSTRYTATVLHRNAGDAKSHSGMGFHDGWGTCADKLGEVARSLA